MHRWGRSTSTPPFRRRLHRRNCIHPALFHVRSRSLLTGSRHHAANRSRRVRARCILRRPGQRYNCQRKLLLGLGQTCTRPPSPTQAAYPSEFALKRLFRLLLRLSSRRRLPSNSLSFKPFPFQRQPLALDGYLLSLVPRGHLPGLQVIAVLPLLVFVGGPGLRASPSQVRVEVIHPLAEAGWSPDRKRLWCTRRFLRMGLTASDGSNQQSSSKKSFQHGIHRFLNCSRAAVGEWKSVQIGGDPTQTRRRKVYHGTIYQDRSIFTLSAWVSALATHKLPAVPTLQLERHRSLGPTGRSPRHLVQARARSVLMVE